MNMDFDTEKFIIQIQNQPAIWNTKCADYSDRNLKQAAWEQIVNAYGAGVSTDEKKNLGKLFGYFIFKFQLVVILYWVSLKLG